jgi:hypothetical protein
MKKGRARSLAFTATSVVLPGFMPGIHGFLSAKQEPSMAGTSPAMTTDTSGVA